MKKYILFSGAIYALSSCFSQVQFWSDNFEDIGAPSSATRTPENNSGVGGPPLTSYFIRTDASGISMVGGPYTSFEGSKFWAGEDHDTPFGASNAEQQIEWTGINISGKTSLSFRGLFGANSTNGSWDNFNTGSGASGFGVFSPPSASNDYIIIEYAIDAAPYTQLIAFFGDDIIGPIGTAKKLKEDTNGDFIGDGTVLNQAMSEISKSIPGTGTTMKLRIRVYSNGGNEEWGIDNFRLFEIPAGPEINVLGNGTTIIDGDISPSTADHTDFGSIGVCSSTFDRTFTIQNTGTSNLTISSTTITGAGSADYSIITAPTSPVAAGGSTTMVVRFNPSSTGPRNATLNITNNDGDESTYDFALTGNGIEPEINVQGNSNNIVDGDLTPTTIDFTDFGSQSVCSGTIARTFTIQNSGTSNLPVTAVNITGTHASDFTLTALPSNPVAPAGSTTFQITFNPSANGIRSATINISNGDCDESTYDFAIQGTGTDPEINVQGNSINILDGDISPTTTDHTDFGNQIVCSGTIVRTFTIQNTGASNLTVGTVTISGTNAADYSVIATPTSPVPSGGSTTFQISFNPSANGIRTATISFTNDDCDEGTFDFALQGNGVEPEVNVQGNSTNIADGDLTPTTTDHTDFGNQSVCSGTIVRTFTIQNLGTANLTLSNPTMSGVNAADFSVISNPTAPIIPGGSSTFQVSFNPSSNGIRSATISFTNSDCDESTYNFDIQGTGDPDATPPNAICQNISINLNASGNAGILASQVDNGSNDACGSVTLSVTPNTFTCANVGNNNVVLTVTDVAGNTATCSSTITIVDNIAPTVITQNITTYLDNVGNTNITAAQINNGSIDNCSISSISVNPSSFTCSNTGNNNVIFTVTDQSGNTSTATVIVNVVDSITPVFINIPNDIQINSQALTCGTNVSWTPPTISDNCNGATISATHNPGDFFPNGSTTIIYTGSDASGNSVTASFNIIVTDSAAPIPDITNLPDIIGTCNATVTSTPNATDNCAGNIVGTTTDPLSYSSQGTFTITWSYNDGNGNISTQNQNVIIDDNISPVISAMPGDTTLYTDPGLCSTTYSWSIPSAGDNCNLQSLSGNANPGDNFTSGAHVVIYTATDDAGNTSTDSFTITVVDNEPPVFNSCPANINGCENEIINYPVPTGTDNCSSTTISYSGPGSGTIYPVGTTTNTYILMDAAGNADTCSFTVTILPAPTVNFNAVLDSICITAGTVSLSGTPAGGTFSGPGVTGNTFDPTIAGLGNHLIDYLYTDVNGCSKIISDTLTVLGCTGIDENPLIVAMIFPNPANQYLNVQISSNISTNYSYTIYDILGKQELAGSMNSNELLINIENFRAGSYILRLKSESGGERIFKFLIQ